MTNEKPLWYKESDEAKPTPQSAKGISPKIGEALRAKKKAARRIPNAELVVIKGGGPECLVSHHRYMAPIMNLLICAKGYMSASQ